MLKIGAMTREVETEESIDVAKHFPIFADGRSSCDPQVRNFVPWAAI